MLDCYRNVSMQNKGGFSHEMFVFFSFYFFRYCNFLDFFLMTFCQSMNVLPCTSKIFANFFLIKNKQLHISAFYLSILYLTQKSVLSISKQTTNFVKKIQDS